MCVVHSIIWTHVCKYHYFLLCIYYWKYISSVIQELHFRTISTTTEWYVCNCKQSGKMLNLSKIILLIAPYQSSVSPTCDIPEMITKIGVRWWRFAKKSLILTIFICQSHVIFMTFISKEIHQILCILPERRSSFM